MSIEDPKKQPSEYIQTKTFGTLVESLWNEVSPLSDSKVAYEQLIALLKKWGKLVNNYWIEGTAKAVAKGKLLVSPNGDSFSLAQLSTDSADSTGKPSTYTAVNGNESSKITWSSQNHGLEVKTTFFTTDPQTHAATISHGFRVTTTAQQLAIVEKISYQRPLTEPGSLSRSPQAYQTKQTVDFTMYAPTIHVFTLH